MSALGSWYLYESLVQPVSQWRIGEKEAQPINSRQLSNSLETLLPPSEQCRFLPDNLYRGLVYTRLRTSQDWRQNPSNC